MTQILRFLTVLCFFPFALNAQMTQIPNASFEEEDTMDYPKPLGWWESHNNWALPNGPSFPFSTDKTFLESYDENFSWRLETVEGFVFGFFGKYVPGVLTNGTPSLPATAVVISGLSIDESFISGGVAFADEPTKFYGYYLYTPVAADSAWAHIKFWDASGAIVSEGSWSTTDAATDWTRFEIDLSYSGTPDSMLMIISSSANPNADHVGSVMFVDSVGFLYEVEDPNGILSPDNTVANLYPNPASDLVIIDNPFEGQSEIQIFNAVGDRLYSDKMEALREEVSLTDWAAGTYVCRITSGSQTATATFQVR